MFPETMILNTFTHAQKQPFEDCYFEKKPPTFVLIFYKNPH